MIPTAEAFGLENLALTAILNGYVEGVARDEADWAEEARRSGLSESEWMARNSSYFEQLVKSGEYPIFTKIAMEARHPRLSRDDQFRHGLERVLDCIAAALPSTAEPPVPAHRAEGQEDRDGQP